MRTLMLVWFLASGYLAIEAILVLNQIQADRRAAAFSNCGGIYENH